MEYNVTRTCQDCGQIDAFALSKIESAFELYDFKQVRDTPCSKCSSLKWQSIGHCPPPIDQGLLDRWGQDANLRFMSQDEELILAEMQYFPMILKAIDDANYLPNKIKVLCESICVLLFDNSFPSDEYSAEEEQSRKEFADIIRPELIQRKQQIIDSREFIMDYIKEVVFPQIGIDFIKIE